MVGTNNILRDKPETVVANYKSLVDLTLKMMPESQTIICGLFHGLDFDGTIYDYTPSQTG